MPPRPDELFPLRPELPLPPGVAERELLSWLQTVRVADAPAEIVNYCNSDFRRFVYTWGLVREASGSPGKWLELGANPYFTTMLLAEYTPHQWDLANYFGPGTRHGENFQDVDYVPRSHVADHPVRTERRRFVYQHFNIEEETFPYPDASFDGVLFCEIIEHLLMDPAAVLREIRRVLRPGGCLVLTTPNVSRLENVARMVAGANIYDPYSGYGPYGRHNREYNKHELWLLLRHVGFEIREMFTADVHENVAASYIQLDTLNRLVAFRAEDIGQYIFLRGTASGTVHVKRPAWLYRSYPANELD